MKKTNLKNAQSPGGAGQSAVQSTDNATDFSSGHLPVRKNTVIAEVLAHLLDGHHVTGMEAVFDMSSTRLSHHIWALREDHGWSIDRRDKVVGTKDGRIQTITEYWLNPNVIEGAMVRGARAWIDEVRRQRLALRRQAAEAQRKAERFEVAKRLVALVNPAQFNLFGSGA